MSRFGGGNRNAPRICCSPRVRWTVVILVLSLFFMYEAGSIRKLTVDSFGSLNNHNLDLAVDDDSPSKTTESIPLLTQKNPPTTTPPAPTLIRPHYRLDKKDRLFTLVHVGKAGGMTVRSATSLMCRLNTRKNNTPEKVDQCIYRHLPRHNVLDRAVQHYFHMFAVNETKLAASTSFLVTLRNPISRIISNFRYSHPLNCNQPHWLHKSVVVRPWGCEVLGHLKNPRSTDYRLYKQCFPSAGFEDMAQSVLSPWPTTDHFRHANLTLAQQHNCRWVAREFLQGKWSGRPSPHMRYNYEYYRNWTLLAYPEKEFFAVRTNQEWEDLKALDVALGGKGLFRKEGRKESHGSELFEPSPVSTQAIQKLCCVLEREISMYEDLVNHMINLNATEKEDCMEEVRQKCGIAEEWGVWRRKCQEHLDRDKAELQRIQSRGNNEFVKEAMKLPQVIER